MINRLMEKKRQEEGFTLVELLIVIVILGILAAIVVFAVGGITDKGHDAACKSDLKSVETAVEAYYAKNTKYPDGTTEVARYKTLTDAKFLKTAPTTSNGYSITLDTGGAVSPSVANCDVP